MDTLKNDTVGVVGVLCRAVLCCAVPGWSGFFSHHLPGLPPGCQASGRRPIWMEQAIDQGGETQLWCDRLPALLLDRNLNKHNAKSQSVQIQKQRRWTSSKFHLSWLFVLARILLYSNNLPQASIYHYFSICPPARLTTCLPYLHARFPRPA